MSSNNITAFFIHRFHCLMYKKFQHFSMSQMASNTNQAQTSQQYETNPAVFLSINVRSKKVMHEFESSQQSLADFMMKNRKTRVVKLGTQIENEFRSMQKHFEKRHLMKEKVIAEMKRVFLPQGYFVVPIGSFVTKASPVSSDLDIVLLSTLNENKLGKKSDKFYTSSMVVAHNILYNDLECKKIFYYNYPDGKKRLEQRLLKARIPLLRLHPMNFKMEIQFDRSEAIRNSLFVKSAVMLDERVAYLHYWLSNLLRLCGIKGSHEGLFSSYHSFSLVVHFMQYQNHPDMEPVLPLMLDFDKILDPSSPLDEVIHKLDENKKMDYKSPNEMCFGELILRFIDFYLNLDMKNNLLDVATGRNVQRGLQRADKIYLSDAYSPDVIRLSSTHSPIKMLKTALRKARESLLLNEPLPIEYFVIDNREYKRKDFI